MDRSEGFPFLVSRFFLPFSIFSFFKTFFIFFNFNVFFVFCPHCHSTALVVFSLYTRRDIDSDDSHARPLIHACAQPIVWLERERKLRAGHRADTRQTFLIFQFYHFFHFFRFLPILSLTSLAPPGPPGPPPKTSLSLQKNLS